jgi:integrase
MRVRPKGINSYTAKLADGTTKTYWYAWKGGPRLQGDPGTPEFISSYNEAAAQKVRTPEGRLLSLLQAYQASDDFRQLAPRARDDYAGIIEKVIEPKYSDFPLSGLTDKRTRGIFLEWRDKLALKSRRQTDYAWTILARVLSWSKDRGRISINPCERGGRIYRGSRAEKISTADDESAFLKLSSAHLHLPLLLALWTGQRQGDLLRLPWSVYDGTHIRLRQSKRAAESLFRLAHHSRLYWIRPQSTARLS